MGLVPNLRTVLLVEHDKPYVLNFSELDVQWRSMIIFSMFSVLVQVYLLFVQTIRTYQTGDHLTWELIKLPQRCPASPACRVGAHATWNSRIFCLVFAWKLYGVALLRTPDCSMRCRSWVICLMQQSIDFGKCIMSKLSLS
jgi:hypothetical protein